MKNTNYYNVTDNPIRLLFDKKAISYGKAHIEIRKLEKEIKEIDDWFERNGEFVGNLKFFQVDAHQTDLIERSKELKEKLCL